MADWGKLFADPVMRTLAANPEVLALASAWRAAGLGLVLDAGCGAGRHLGPLAGAGLRVVGVDREKTWEPTAATRGAAPPGEVFLVQADLGSLPFAAQTFDGVLSVHAISHGDTRAFEGYCAELDRVLKPGGRLFIIVSPREAVEVVRLPATVELEPGTFIHIATPDGELVHHLPTPAELAARFPRYAIHRLETVRAPIPFMGGAELPQLVFLARKR